MPNSIKANIEFVANILVVVAIVVVAVVLVKRHVFHQPVNDNNIRQQERMLVGTQLNISNVDWAQNQKSLVFFLKKDCVYCKSIAPFYRQLIESASKSNVKWLAVLPDSIDEGRKYVQSLELPIENVQSGPLSSYRIQATPTVLFVDKQGVVRAVWIGASPSREQEIRDELLKLFEA
jgi:peroxiredoxin